MKETPLIFTADSVRGILSGIKTQTRRLLSVSNVKVDGQRPKLLGPNVPGSWEFLDFKRAELHLATPEILRVPHVSGSIHEVTMRRAEGDRIWVKETFRRSEEPRLMYAADWPKFPHTAVKWRPPIFMPRHLSRIDLRVVELRFERLQHLTEEDAKAEGVDPYIPGHGPVPRAAFYGEGGYHNAAAHDTWRMGYQHAWNDIHSPRWQMGEPPAWDENPWVMAISFKRIRPA